MLTRENASLKFKIDELTAQVRSTKDELTETQNEAKNAQEKLKTLAVPVGGESHEELRGKVEKLEAERAMFREEIKVSKK